MISLIWLILAWIGVFPFSWIPVLIEAVIALCVHVFRAEENGINFIFYCLCGIVYFSALKVFFGLTLPLWCIIFSPLVALAVFFVPGGLTIVNIAFKFLGFMTVPIWAIIISVLLDIAIFAGMRKA